MAQIDASINDPTPTDGIAARVDVYLIATSLIRQAGLANRAEAGDLLELAQFLAGDDF